MELVGKDSPGPAVYSPNMTFFKGDKHEAKSFTMVSIPEPLHKFSTIVKKRVSFGSKGGIDQGRPLSNDIQFAGQKDCIRKVKKQH